MIDCESLEGLAANCAASGIEIAQSYVNAIDTVERSLVLLRLLQCSL